jgi:hypothetical protein
MIPDAVTDPPEPLWRGMLRHVWNTPRTDNDFWGHGTQAYFFMMVGMAFASRVTVHWEIVGGIAGILGAFGREWYDGDHWDGYDILSALLFLTAAFLTLAIFGTVGD